MTKKYGIKEIGSITFYPIEKPTIRHKYINVSRKVYKQFLQWLSDNNIKTDTITNTITEQIGVYLIDSDGAKNVMVAGVDLHSTPSFYVRDIEYHKYVVSKKKDEE
jgi:hypothetical protein